MLRNTSSRCHLSPSRLCPATLQAASILWTELDAPAPHGLVAQPHTPLEQQLLDRSERHVEAVIEPDAVADDLGREAVTLVEVGAHKSPTLA
jgi:hypothetical protein